MNGPIHKPIVGLVGGIGSGKSQVAAMLADHGGYVVNADQFGHEALRQVEIKRRLKESWGDAIFDQAGEVDRRCLGQIVFAEPAEREALERIVFPYITKRIKEEIHSAGKNVDARFVVLDAAIMIETGWSRECDWLVFVHAPRAQRQARVAENRGWNDKEVQQRAQAQISLTEKVTRADFVLDNSRDLEFLSRQVRALLPKLGIEPN